MQPNHQWVHNPLGLALQGSLDVQFALVAADGTEPVQHRYRRRRSSLASIALGDLDQAAVGASSHASQRPLGNEAALALEPIAKLGSILLVGCKALRWLSAH